MKPSLIYGMCLPAFALVFALFLVKPLHAQDFGEAAVGQPLEANALPTGWTLINEDEYTKWRLDVNSACIFSDHHYTLNLPEDPANMSDIRLTMSNHDVDYLDPQECEEGPEFDNASLNGQPLGILSGANESFSLNSWPLEPSDLVSGDNNISINTDATGTGCWCVAVQYIELQAKVGFNVVEFTPADGDLNRDFHADKVDLTVTFSTDVNPATVNNSTFLLSYVSADDALTHVEGTITMLAPNQFRFTPNADLLPGVRYSAWIRDGATGVKSASGEPLEDEKIWPFWTVPNLDAISAFDYGAGSLCPPSDSPCNGLEIAVFQVARNAIMVPNKDTVARLYLRWQEHTGVLPGSQITEMDVQVALLVTPGGGSYSVAQKVKRPDLYTQAEVREAQNTINLYHKPASGFLYTVQVTPLPQTNATPVVFTASLLLSNAGKSPVIAFNHYFLKAAEWSGGIPADVRANQLDSLSAGSQLALDMFPAIAVNPVNKGDLTLDYTYTGANVTDATCGVVKEVMCPLAPLVSVKDSETSCIYLKMKPILGQNYAVGVTIPPSICPAPNILAITSGDVGTVSTGAVMQLKPLIHPLVLTHELGHAYSISPANNPNNGHRNSHDGIEGFQVRAKTNRSRTENPDMVYSLMHTTIAEKPQTEWIHDDDYEALFDTVTAVQAASVASVNAGLYILVSGVVDVGASSAYLAPLTLQETLLEPPTPGICTAALLDGASAVLASVTFTPGVEVHSAYASDTYESVAQAVESPTADGPQPFAISLPWNASAQALRISCNSSPLLTLARSAATPTVAFTAPAEGATLSGEVEVTWTGSDSNGDALSYQLQFSDDHGATWAPLTVVGEATSFTLDTSILPSGGARKLRVLVTDGFNTAFVERTVTIANPLSVVATVPADSGENVPLNAPMHAMFNTPIDPESLSTANFWVDRGNRITGTLSLGVDGRTVTFQPDEPLAASTLYRVHVEDTLRDISGATLPLDQVWSFRTISDTVPPLVERVSPKDGEVDVPLNAMIGVYFSEALHFNTPTTSFRLVDAQNRPVAGFSQYYHNDQRHVFVPEVGLQPNTVYTATVSTEVKDWNNNTLQHAYVWRFTTGASNGPSARIVGNYSEKVEDIDNDGLYDTLTIFVDVQSHDGIYNLNARLLDKSGQLIQWKRAEFGKDILPGFLDAGVHRLALTFDGPVIRAHQVDGPYFIDSLHYYGGFSITGRSDHRFEVYQTLPYSVTQFTGLLSFKPLPDRLVEWSTTRDNVWNLRDHTISLAAPVDEVTYTIIGNSDPRVGVSIDSDNFIDINPVPGIEVESTVTVEARDSAGNRAEGSFLVKVQEPEATYLFVEPALNLSPNQEVTIDVEVQDQFRRLFTEEAFELTLSNNLESATVTPGTVMTSLGRASFTYSTGANQGTDFISIDADGGPSAAISVVIAESELFIPSLERAP